jgi:hypothetical protein
MARSYPLYLPKILSDGIAGRAPGIRAYRK